MAEILGWNDRLCDLMAEQKLTVAEFGRVLAGPNAGEKQISAWTGRLYKYAKRSDKLSEPVPRPRGKQLEQMAAALGVSPIFLEFGDLEPTSEASVGALRHDTRKKIELRGRGQGGEDGEISLDVGVVGYADMPPSLEGVNGAFGVYVHGDSMVPRYFSGDIVFMNPHRPIRTGDFVFLKVQRDEHDIERGFVKRLISKTEKEVVVEQYNPPKKLRFPARTVVGLYYILRPGE